MIAVLSPTTVRENLKDQAKKTVLLIRIEATGKARARASFDSNNGAMMTEYHRPQEPLPGSPAPRRLLAPDRRRACDSALSR